MSAFAENGNGKKEIMIVRTMPGPTPRISVRANGLRAAALALLVCLGGCGDWFRNLTASFGGTRAGSRGNLRVLFINNTPHRAVFTFGSYDQSDPQAVPSFRQFGPEDFDTNLEGDATSAFITIPCARVFAIGSEELLQRIRDRADASLYFEEGLVDGVEFLGTAADGEGDGDLVSQGFAPAFEGRIGVDFSCNALLIFRLEFNDLGPAPFLIDFELVPAASDR